ncbi:MAG TPA: hypothetical protein VFE50_00990 [Cyclobacteriaceae bacterium]|nr:hypothetical protein [Cyclobacteriaceae bacterium]
MFKIGGVVLGLLISFCAMAQINVVEERLGKDAKKSSNNDNTFTLYQASKENASGIPVLNYVIVRNADKKIVVEGAVTMGAIEWTATYELEESRSLGAGQAQGQKRKIDLRPFL